MKKVFSLVILNLLVTNANAFQICTGIYRANYTIPLDKAEKINLVLPIINTADVKEARTADGKFTLFTMAGHHIGAYTLSIATNVNGEPDWSSGSATAITDANSNYASLRLFSPGIDLQIECK